VHTLFLWVQMHVWWSEDVSIIYVDKGIETIIYLHHQLKVWVSTACMIKPLTVSKSRTFASICTRALASKYCHIATYSCKAGLKFAGSVMTISGVLSFLVTRGDHRNVPRSGHRRASLSYQICGRGVDNVAVQQQVLSAPLHATSFQLFSPPALVPSLSVCNTPVEIDKGSSSSVTFNLQRAGAVCATHLFKEPLQRALQLARKTHA
jgi:hypothetical protein